MRKAGVRLITGLEDIDKKLSTMKVGAANKIARPTLTKGARVLLKAAKAKVPPQYKDAKKALGMKVDAKGGRSRNEQRAKVGGGVGIKAEKREKMAAKHAEKRQGKTGVGIGVANIHWAVLGTKERTQKTTGKSTGSMEPLMPGLMKYAVATAKSGMETAMRAEATARLAQLAAK